MDSISLDIERRLRVSQAEARALIVRFLRANEFTLTAEQISMVSAKRGSQLVGAVQQKKLPITVRAMFMPDAAGSTVSIHIGDAWRSGVGKVWGMNGPYTTLLNEVQSALDAVLAPVAIDPAEFEMAAVSTSTRNVPLLSTGNAATVKAGAAVAGKVDRLITPGDHRSTPKALTEVVLHSSKGNASFDRMAAEGLLTVGLLVSTKPGAMPANLAADVEALTAKLETSIAAKSEGRVVCDLDDAEIPVAEFLGKQAMIRNVLPLRTLHVCTTCKFEKVVNPDFEKLQEKNRRKRILQGAVGATITTSGISPFLLVGSVLKFKNFDIPFVCPRCQGLDADSSVVTFCPNCGERRDEAVLRNCRRCKYDFGTPHREHTHEFWGDDMPDPVVTFTPPPPPSPIAAPVVPTPAVLTPPVVAVTTPVLARPVVAVPTLAPPAAVVAPATPAGWHTDTTGRHQLRYWNGTRWTEHVSDNGVQAVDPV